jgi:hypothetical protein
MEEGLGVCRRHELRTRPAAPPPEEIDPVASSDVRSHGPETERFGNPNSEHCSDTDPHPQRMVAVDADGGVVGRHAREQGCRDRDVCR